MVRVPLDTKLHLAFGENWSRPAHSPNTALYKPLKHIRDTLHL